MDLLTITHFLNGFLMIAIPIGLGMYLTSKFRLSWVYWGIGAVVFIISQVFHIPFNTYILNPILKNIQTNIPGVGGTLLVAALLGLSAGVFESIARYGMYRWWIKDNRTWKVGVLAGAGHGGIEAIILGGLVLLAYINMMVYRNMDLSSLNLTPDKLELIRQQVQAYWSSPWYLTMLGALERIFTIPLHIAASVIVLQVFTRKPGHQVLKWLGFAILLHAFTDGSVVFVASQTNAYITEAVLGVLGVLDLVIIFALRQPEPEQAAPMDQPVSTTTPGFRPLPMEETSDNLENTRYQ